MNQNVTPSTAILRKLCSSIAADLGQAPLRTSNYETLTALTKQFISLEKAMTNTSDMVSSALSHANDLIKEADKWQSIAQEGGTLKNSLEQSMSRIAGHTDLLDSAAVSSDVAHP